MVTLTRVALCGVLALGLSCQKGAGRHEVGPPIATVASLTGPAEVLRGQAADWTRLRAGTPLYDDDRVRTFKGAEAQLAFRGGSSLRVEEETLISLGARPAGGGIVVERGTVEGQLEPGLELRTPALAAESAPPRDIVIR